LERQARPVITFAGLTMDVTSRDLANSGKKWSVGQILLVLLGAALLFWGIVAKITLGVLSIL